MRGEEGKDLGWKGVERGGGRGGWRECSVSPGKECLGGIIFSGGKVNETLSAMWCGVMVEGQGTHFTTSYREQ